MWKSQKNSNQFYYLSVLCNEITSIFLRKQREIYCNNVKILFSKIRQKRRSNEVQIAKGGNNFFKLAFLTLMLIIIVKWNIILIYGSSCLFIGHIFLTNVLYLKCNVHQDKKHIFLFNGTNKDLLCFQNFLLNIYRQSTLKYFEVIWLCIATFFIIIFYSFDLNIAILMLKRLSWLSTIL